MIRALAVALASITASACGGAAVEAPAAPAAVDGDKATHEAKGLVGEVYESLGRGDTDGILTLLSDPLVVFGPHTADALATRADALLALKQVVDPKSKKHARLSSRSLSVVAGRHGHSAWAVDTFTFGGTAYATLAVLTNAGDVWTVGAVSLARTPTMKAIKKQLKDAPVAAPKANAAPPAGTPLVTDAKAKGAVDTFTRGLADPDQWGAELSARADAVVIGPAGEIVRGKSDMKALWKKRRKSGMHAVATGPIASAITADGQLAWVSAPVIRVEDGADPMPLREFAVFTASGDSGGEWRLLAVHDAYVPSN